MPLRAEPGGFGNASSWLSTGSQEADRIAPESVERFKRRFASCGAPDEVAAVTNCGMTGIDTCAAGGILSTRWSASAGARTGGMGPQTHPKVFWLRWHDSGGRLRRYATRDYRRRDLGVAYSSRGAWAVSRHPVLNTALSKAVLRKYGFLFLSDLRAN